MNTYMQDRNKLLNRVSALSAMRFGKAAQSLSKEQWRASKAEEQDLLMEYAENLSYVCVSRCPICNEEVQIPIDLDGLDGPWWWRLCPVDLPPVLACEHYQVFLGAMDFKGMHPAEVTKTVMVGPGKPFINNRLLEMEGVKAVLSSVSIAPGYMGFLITYFSEEPIDQADLHQEWRHETYSLRNSDGEPVASEQKLDPWNFDIRRWIDSDKLRFIKTGDESLSILNKMPVEYDVKDGVEYQQYISNGEVSYMEAPQGGETGIYDTVD